MPELRQKEIDDIIAQLATKSIVILGKMGIGKTHTLMKVIEALPQGKVSFFAEPPTAKTALISIVTLYALNVPKKTSKDDIITEISTQQDTVYLCIDQIEKCTPSLIDALDSLMNTQNVRLILSGHLGSKKKYNSTWMKAKATLLKELQITESMNLIEQLWKQGDKESKKIILEQSKGIPGKVIALISDATNGILPEGRDKYVDFMPILLIIGTVGLTIRIIGYGYGSMEQYIIGGIVAAIFWGGFWIYRGYISGWFGERMNQNQQRNKF